MTRRILLDGRKARQGLFFVFSVKGERFAILRRVFLTAAQMDFHAHK